MRMRTGIPLPELLTYEPEDLATVLQVVDEQDDAAKDANRGR